MKSPITHLENPTLIFMSGEQILPLVPTEDKILGGMKYPTEWFWLNGRVPVDFWLEQTDEFGGVSVHSNRPPDPNNPQESNYDLKKHPEALASYDHVNSKPIPNEEGMTQVARRIIAWEIDVIEKETGEQKRVAVSLLGHVAAQIRDENVTGAKIYQFPQRSMPESPENEEQRVAVAGS